MMVFNGKINYKWTFSFGWVIIYNGSSGNDGFQWEEGFFQVWFMVPPFFQGDEVEAMISHRSALVPLSFRSVVQSEVDPWVTTGTDWGISPSKIRVLTKQNDGSTNQSMEF